MPDGGARPAQFWVVFGGDDHLTPILVSLTSAGSRALIAAIVLIATLPVVVATLPVLISTLPVVVVKQLMVVIVTAFHRAFPFLSRHRALELAVKAQAGIMGLMGLNNGPTFING